MSCVLMVVFMGDIKDMLVVFLVGGFFYWVYLWLVSIFKVCYLGEFCMVLVIGVLVSMVVYFGFVYWVDDIIIGVIMFLVFGVLIINVVCDIVFGNVIFGIVWVLEVVLMVVFIGCVIVFVLWYL